MNAAAVNLVPRVLLLQLFVFVAIFVVYGAIAPDVLLLDRYENAGVLASAFTMTVITETIALFATYRRLERIRYLLRALALGSRAFEPDDVAALGRVPEFVTIVTMGTALVLAATLLVPDVRPAGIDPPTALCLFGLLALLVGAFGMPLYVLVRTIVSEATELVPVDVAEVVLGTLARKDIPRRRVKTHMALAVTTPVCVVALGAALVAFSHIRYAEKNARIDIAIAVARAAGEGLPGALPLTGQKEALKAAQNGGFSLQVDPGPGRFAERRDDAGRMTVEVPFEDGHAIARFDAVSDTATLVRMLFAALVASVLALWIGVSLGDLLADDLVVATRAVESLGDVKRRGEQPQSPAPRLASVEDLGRVIALLAQRFRVFATAQERAIEAREAALRLRGLLFASVSHDLKSPLNAILGFCALASIEPLAEGQLESVRIIERRARELLALIETILDAARVEAQKLTLSRQETGVREVLTRAIARGDELGPMDAAPVALTLGENLPRVLWDEPRVAQAIAALVGHAKRLSPKGGVRVQARLTRAEDTIAIDVVDPSTVFKRDELVRLLEAKNAATAPRRLGGLAMGLSLAQALVALHGGSLVVDARKDGGFVFRIRLPLGI